MKGSLHGQRALRALALVIAGCSHEAQTTPSASTSAGSTAAAGSGKSAGASGSGTAQPSAAGDAGAAMPVAGAPAAGHGEAGRLASAGQSAAVGGAGAGAGAAGVPASEGGAGTAAAAGSGGAASKPDCNEPPPASTLEGWAASSGMGAMTTTGGGSASPKTVKSVSELNAALSGDTPAVVYVKGKLEPGVVRMGANKTVVGLCGAEVHGHISVSGVSNVIVRNLKVVGYGAGDCKLDPKYDAAVGCSSGDDAITVQNAHHIWVDHCDVSDGTDGNLDITNGADFVTVSWTKFHYTPRTDPSGNDSTGASGHRFSNLIGGADNVPADMGHLNVSWHHNWWADNVNQRMPRTRAGKIHLWNNLFTASGNSYCTNAGHNATLLVENNVYQDVSNPLSPDADGDMRAQDNIFSNTKGTKAASGKGFMPAYTYHADPADTVEAAVRAGAGPH